MVKWQNVGNAKSEMRKMRENAQMRNYYYLLYEEFSYAMNVGDVGRVESCFLPLIFLFKAVGKHKYARHMMNFLFDLHYVYPEPLR